MAHNGRADVGTESLSLALDGKASEYPPVAGSLNIVLHGDKAHKMGHDLSLGPVGWTVLTINMEQDFSGIAGQSPVNVDPWLQPGPGCLGLFVWII